MTLTVDLDSQFNFGDESGLTNFFLIHRFVHDNYQVLLQQQYGVAFSTFALSSQDAEEQWAAKMKKKQPTPQALTDWLQLHNALHMSEFQAIAGTGNISPDLSVVDFSDQGQFYDWLNSHQELHDYIDSILGVS